MADAPGMGLAFAAGTVSFLSPCCLPLGLAATAAGRFLFDNQPLLNKVAGIAILAMGLLFIGSVFVTSLNREWRPDSLASRAGRGGPIVAGAAFAIAWTPC